MFFKQSFSQKTISMTGSMVVHRKAIEKQNEAIGKTYFYYKRSFLHKKIEIVSMGLDEKDMEK